MVALLPLPHQTQQTEQTRLWARLLLQRVEVQLVQNSPLRLEMVRMEGVEEGAQSVRLTEHLELVVKEATEETTLLLQSTVEVVEEALARTAQTELPLLEVMEVLVQQTQSLGAQLHTQEEEVLVSLPQEQQEQEELEVVETEVSAQQTQHQLLQILEEEEEELVETVALRALVAQVSS
jgi:hypothetical protein